MEVTSWDSQVFSGQKCVHVFAWDMHGHSSSLQHTPKLETAQTSTGSRRAGWAVPQTGNGRPGIEEENITTAHLHVDRPREEHYNCPPPRGQTHTHNVQWRRPDAKWTDCGWWPHTSWHSSISRWESMPIPLSLHGLLTAFTKIPQQDQHPWLPGPVRKRTCSSRLVHRSPATQLSAAK